VSGTYAKNRARNGRIPKNAVFHLRTPVVKTRERNQLVLRASDRSASIYGAAVNVAEMNIRQIWSLVHSVIWSFNSQIENDQMNQ